jgi:hypothetical protein
MTSSAESREQRADSRSRAESRKPRAGSRLRAESRKPTAEGRRAAACFLAGAALVLAGLSGAAAQSWPQWRGPAGDGRVSDFRPPATWPERFSKAWEATVGSGHASPVLAGSRVIVHTRQGDDEVIAAYDLQTGKALWQDRYEAPYTMNPAARGHGPGPKSTPAIADGRVFTLGHQRHPLGRRSRHGRRPVAHVGGRRPAALWHRHVSRRGRIPRRGLHGRPRPRGVHRVRGRHRRRALALGGRRSRLRHARS